MREQRPVPKIALRPAGPDDAAFLLWLEEVCMKVYAEQLWGRWRPSATVATLDVSRHDIIAVDGQDQGCLAHVWKADALHVTRLFLAPQARNQGIGRGVLKDMIGQADKAGVPVRLSVLTTNSAALRFYLRAGFTIEKETEEKRFLGGRRINKKR